MADRVRVLIATTQGPVEVEGIIDLEAGVGSIVSRGSSADVVVDLLTPYRNFVAKGSGVIARAFGHDAFRLELSGDIHTGESWQLGVFLAHDLHKRGLLAEAGEAAAMLLWVTGQVDYQFRVGAVGHVAEKIAASLARLEAERSRGIAVHALWPKADHAPVEPALRERLQELGIEIHEVDQARDLLAGLDPLFAPQPPEPEAPQTADAREPALPRGALTLANVARRQLNVIFALDCSGSMSVGEKMSSLNMAMRIAVQEMQKAARSNPMVDLIVRVVRFATGADWHIASVAATDLDWVDLMASGDTDMGEALKLIAEVMPTLSAQARQLSPAIILLSDGYPSDDFEAGLAALLKTPAGAKAVRVAIAIGQNADRATLAEFIDDPKFPPLDAYNTEELIERIRWVSSALLSHHSQGQELQPPPGAAPATPAAAADLVW